MTMILQIIFLGIATLLFAFGLFLCSLIIHYLKSKDELHKTGFDRVMIDAIWSIIFYTASAYFGLVLFTIPMEYSYGFVLGYTLTYNSFRYYFASATFVTILTKLLYIQWPEHMLGASDKKIYRYSLLVRLCLMTFVFSVNYLKPFSEKPPLEFQLLLDDPHEYPRYVSLSYKTVLNCVCL